MRRQALVLGKPHVPWMGRNDRSQSRIAASAAILLAQIEALQDLVVLAKVVLFQVVEQLAAAARHCE